MDKFPQTIEDRSKRTHYEKDFNHPTNSNLRMKVRSMGLLHVLTNEGFKDIETELPSYRFPEGKVLQSGTDLHEIMDLPTWGRKEVNKEGNKLDIYDESDMLVFSYSKPIISPKGEHPYKVISKLGIESKVQRNHSIKDGILVKKETTIDAKFEIKDNKLCFRTPTVLTKEMSAFDDTSNGTETYANQIREGATSTVYQDDGTAQWHVRDESGQEYRCMFRMAMPSGTGTISDIKFYVWGFEDGGGSNKHVNVYEMTRAWTTAQTTWASYSTGNSWTTAGGDYNTSVVDASTNFSNGDSLDTDAYGNAGKYQYMVLKGTGATRELSSTWGDNIDLILKAGDTSTYWVPFPSLFSYYGTPTATPNAPYLLVTYSAAAAGPAKLKTWNGLPVAKIKTYNGLDIAKVKTINQLP